MSIEETSSIRIGNYKCVGTEACGFDVVLPVNLIIGRNNSGKSTFIDLVDYLTNPRELPRVGATATQPRVTFAMIPAEEKLRRVFSANTSGGVIGENHWQFGERLIGKPVTWELRPGGSMVFSSTVSALSEPKYAEYQGYLGREMESPFAAFTFRRIVADRDITPEQDGAFASAESNGRGATTAIQRFITKSSLPTDLVEKTLLEELNRILGPDGNFTHISVQHHENANTWEVYLEEANKGRIPLSRTGSGLKTILLVLVFLYLVPAMEGKPVSQYLFGFEELENNLHPALQRRLLLYLRDIALESGCRFFLTSHSSVCIDPVLSKIAF